MTGRFAVDVQFQDSTLVDSVRSIKTIAMQNATEVEDGKVIVVSGTCGTSTVAVSLVNSGYRDASGNLVALSSAAKVALRADSSSLTRASASNGWTLHTRANQVALAETTETSAFAVSALAGTSSWTMVIYGS